MSNEKFKTEKVSWGVEKDREPLTLGSSILPVIRIVPDTEAPKEASKDQELMTVTDYCNLMNFQPRLTMDEKKTLAKKVSEYSKEHNVPTGKIPDPLWGNIKTFQKYVFDMIMAIEHLHTVMSDDLSPENQK